MSIKALTKYYPNRNRKLGPLDYLKLAAIDFGWLLIILSIYMFHNIQWPTNPDASKIQSKTFWFMVGVITVGCFITELIVGVLWKLSSSLKAKRM